MNRRVAILLVLLFVFSRRAEAGPLPCAEVSPDVPRVYRAGTRLDYQWYTGPIAAADIDGDGSIDFLNQVSYAGEECSGPQCRVFPLATLFVLYGRGGSFDEPVELVAGAIPDIAVADVDGDQRPDIVFTTGTSGWPSGAAKTIGMDVQLIRNLGGRRFAAPLPLAHFPFYFEGQRVHVADFTGDGWADIYVSFSRDQAAMLINDGGGRAFTPRQSTKPAWAPYPQAVGDLDGDGKLDFVVLTGEGFFLLRGDGQGDFTSRRIAQLPTYGGVPFVADVNGDGHDDVIASTSAGVMVLKGPLDDSRPAQVSPVEKERSINIVALADVNGDGSIDVLAEQGQFSSTEIVASRTLYPLLSISRVRTWLNDGSGGFAPRDGSDSPGPFIVSNRRDVLAADFDADGRVDLAIAEAPGRVAIVRGRGDGTFRMPRLALPERSRLIGNGDLNGDGVDELIAMRDTRLHAGFRTSAGGYQFEELPFDVQPSAFNAMVPATTFCWQAHGGAVGSHPVAVGDVDAAPGRELVIGDGSKLRVFSRDGAGTWTNPVSVDTAAIQALALADFDEQDALLEIALVADANLRVVRGDGAIVFTLPMNAPTLYSLVQTGDFDHDGHQDLIVSRSGTLATSGHHCWGDAFDGTVLFFRGRGSGTFDPARAILTDVAVGSVRAGDFNADGHRDLIVAYHARSGNYGDDHVDLFVGDGGGNFSRVPAGIDDPDTWIRTLAHAVSDLNGDGVDDLVWFSDERVTFYYGSKSGLVRGGSYHSRNEPFVVRVAPSGERTVMYTTALGEAAILEQQCVRRRPARK